MKSLARLFLGVGLVTLALSSVARADAPPKSAREQRLEGLDEEERTLLGPLLERGPIGLVEFAKADELPAVLVASYIDAPAKEVAKVVSTPGEYPKFMRTLDSVEVLSRSETQTSYKWSWQMGVLFLEGENRMTSFAPPPDHPELGYRITVYSERGALGEGRLLWRVFPVSETRSLAMLAMRVDMRDANFVMRQLDAAARSINRSVNLALCYVMLLGTKREAEKRAGKKPALAASVPFEAPALDTAKLKELLGRADLLLMELTQTGLGKLSIVGRMGRKPEAVRPVMTNPESFGKALVPGSYTRITKREGASKTFEWGINLPLVGTSGTMFMREQSGTLFIDATEGALKGGKWRFAMPELASGEAVIVGYSIFDITNTTWLIQKVASVDPAMGYGLAAASQVMMLRALRKRVHEEEQHVKLERSAADLPPGASAPPPTRVDTAAKSPATKTQ